MLRASGGGLMNNLVLLCEDIRSIADKDKDSALMDYRYLFAEA